MAYNATRVLLHKCMLLIGLQMLLIIIKTVDQHAKIATFSPA